MTDIVYIDRVTKAREKEQVYGRFFIEFLYGTSVLSRFFSALILPFLAKIPFFSKLYGYFQKSRFSKWKVKWFIKAFQIDESEFLDSTESFASFNDFFIRKLKSTARPICTEENSAILPADARYLVYPNIQTADGFWVKGKKFSLPKLVKNQEWSQQYAEGSMVIARLCPTDYHRYHFPFSCFANAPKRINGSLYSVNPLALCRNISILTENKRVITELKSDKFGNVLYIEVGATYVGSIHQTFTPEKTYRKGDEKGYFSFGGSCLILLFEKGRILFEKDLVQASKERIEVKGLLGQSLGKIL